MGIWKLLFGLFLVLNLKSLPLLWHIRFFRALGRGILRNRRIIRNFQPHHVFLPTVRITRTPMLELDFNFHKSNSTYFTDLDISRSYHSGVLFGPLFVAAKSNTQCNLIVGAVSCAFKREIKPYREYETWTRVASWDEKWIYMVTHFVEKGSIETDHHTRDRGQVGARGQRVVYSRSTQRRILYASAITQFVCKRGRLTVPPARAMEECNLLQSSSTTVSNKVGENGRGLNTSPATLEDIEARRTANLPIVQLQYGWDQVHELFQEDDTVLATEGIMM